MLRSMIFKNFVKFCEFQSLEFENGVNIIIGGNGTGKSVIFELVRRCMSVDASKSSTALYEESSPAFVICSFGDIPKCDILLTGIWVKQDSEQETIWIKFICLITQDNDTSCYVEKYSVSDKGIQRKGFGKGFYVRKTDLPVLFSFDVSTFEQNKEVEVLIEKDITTLVNLFEKNHPANQEINSKCTKILQQLTDSFVATFAMRSIGPAQWSRSAAFRKPKKENYAYPSTKAEIINDLMKESEKNHFIKILNDLTYPEECTIEHVNEEIKINGSELLKTPERIIEGIYFALLLANPKYKLICLEEPDRGMHPQMVERMHGILTKIIDKIIIIVTHNPFLLSRHTILRTHVCLRRLVTHSDPQVLEVTTKKRKLGNGKNGQENKTSREQNTSEVCLPRKTRSGILKLKDKEITHHVRSVRVFGCPFLDQEQKFQVDPRNFLTDVDDLRKLLFSTRIICVEGKTDKIIIEALFDFVKDTQNDKELLKFNITEKVKQFIVSHQIITLEANTMECKLRAFCESMQIPCSFILDRNAYVKLEKNKQKRKQKIKEIRLTGISDRKMREFTILKDFLEDREGFKKLEEILVEKNIFIWKSGDIEDMVEEGLRECLSHGLDGKMVTYFQCKPGGKDKIKRGILNMATDDLTNLLRDIFSSCDIKRLLVFMHSLWEKL